jgi:hypothetical protein
MLKRTLKNPVFFFFSLCLLALRVNASEKMPPPAIFFEAKTVFILNETGYANIGDRAYDEIKKWGRYKVVENPDEADLVLVLTSRQDIIGFQRNTVTNTYGTVYGDENSASGNTQSYSTGTSTAVTRGTTTAAFFDRRTGKKVWSDTRQWGAFRSATRGIIRDIRTRIEEEEKRRTKANK